MKTATGLAAKQAALRTSGTLNPHPERVADALFGAGMHEPSVFFDAHDLVQVKYEMLRRVRIEHVTVSTAAAAFGLSRATWYQLRNRYDADGMAGLRPRARGPKPRRKKRRQPQVVRSVSVAVMASRPSWSDSMRSCASRY